jgi:hypothetical protein
MTTKPTAAQIDAGVKAGRKAILSVSPGQSGMIPDSALTVFVTEIEAAMRGLPSAGQVPAGCAAGRTALQNYSWFASMSVSDAELTTFVTDIDAAMRAA